MDNIFEGMDMGNMNGGEGPPARRSCGAMAEHHRLMLVDPNYAVARESIENLAFTILEEGRATSWIGVVQIPVVVHVVWNMMQDNIADAQVQSQIDVLNRDFRAQNADLNQAPGIFKALSIDSEIEFFLATTDPDGNATSGITRTQSATRTFRTFANDVKSSAAGGADPWPTDRYLNIWVCPQIVDQRGESILGYAQFPGGPAATDGVVVAHPFFGTSGTATAPFHLGRTTTHEVGHWLNLFHIWGDDGTGCSGTDFVGDTPNQGGPNFGVPLFPSITCGNGPNGDMFVNYMDYVDDEAMVMFTIEQVARMHATLLGPRASLLNRSNAEWIESVMRIMTS